MLVRTGHSPQNTKLDMLDRTQFLVLSAREAFPNPRTGHYAVVRLHEQPQAYPFRTDDGAIPAVVLQFAVENQHDARARRVISLARTALGYSVWCGDRFTEGRLSEEYDTEELVSEALHQVPHWSTERALAEMQGLEGAYRFWAACHFWKAWHSHQGLCKHVAAVLQNLEFREDGLAAALDELDEAYDRLLQPSIQLDIVLEPDAPARDVRQVRGDILSLAAEVAAPLGGLTPEQHSRLHALLAKFEA